MGLNDVCYCANCPDLDSEFIEATVSEGKIVPAFSQIQELFSLQEFDFKMEVDDETKGERRALVFHGKENGGTRTYTVRLLVDSDGILIQQCRISQIGTFPVKVRGMKL